eukprot:3372960-Amphidinium_carterae.1
MRYAGKDLAVDCSHPGRRSPFGSTKKTARLCNTAVMSNDITVSSSKPTTLDSKKLKRRTSAQWRKDQAEARRERLSRF